MILEDIVRSPRLRALGREAPLGPYIDDLVVEAASVGYTSASLRDLLQGVIQFGTFLQERGVTDLRGLRARDVEAFVATQPLKCCRGKYHYPISRGVRGARHVLRFARAAGIASAESTPPTLVYAPLLEEWLRYLEHHRGLAPKSLDLYRRHIRRFLEDLGPAATRAGLRELEPDQVRRYVRHASQGRSRSERKAVVSTLRIFLRFAWSRGYVSRDLDATVERVPSFKEERLPRGPRWEDALRLLDTPDRSTALGRRDYAILNVLLRYGVRAQQVCRLLLEDIQWRCGTIRFAPHKGGRPVQVPLLAPVGESILAYIRNGRPVTRHRYVFLRTRPPFHDLTSSAITSLVTRAFDRAGISSPHRGPHALRHAWATQMLGKGRSLKTIADLLGHRSLETTRIYAKVDIVRLRTVGLPWPEELDR